MSLLVDFNVTVGERDEEEVDLLGRGGECEEDGEDVVDTGVGV